MTAGWPEWVLTDWCMHGDHAHCPVTVPAIRSNDGRIEIGPRRTKCDCACHRGA